MKRAILAAVFAALPFTANAAQCVPTLEMIRQLDKFGEQQIFTMTQKAGGKLIPLNLWANLDSGTWTIIVTGPRGSCIIAHGDDFAAQGFTPANL
jgi:hypothetical protein